MPSRELRKYEHISKDLDPEDVQPINTMIHAALKNLGGRPATYPNTEEGLQAFITNSLAYFEYVENANGQIDDNKRQLILDVDSYAVFVGVSMKTILEYQKRNEQWNRAINLFKDAIGASKKQLALHGLIPSVMAIFDLVNNHNYHSTNEFKLSVNDNADKSTDRNDDLETQIADAGLVWDSETKEFIPKEG